MSIDARLRGLYAISDGTPQVLEKCAQAIAGGARLIQYREKSDDHAKRRHQAEGLLALCRQAKIPLIINDDVALAAAVGADGVHLGQDDPAIAAARAQLGPKAIIGVSCYNRFELAEAASGQGADYIAFGSFFASGTKPLAVRADPELLRRARRELRLPTVAIGGITPENGRSLIDAGADMLAVIQAIFAQQDISAAARRFSALFKDGAP